jgi:hypothetical protein
MSCLFIRLDMNKRAMDNHKKRDTTARSMRHATNDNSKTSEHRINSHYQHHEFLQAMIEQQKLVQQQEFEHEQQVRQRTRHLNSVCVFSSCFKLTVKFRIERSTMIV